MKNAKMTMLSIFFLISVIVMENLLVGAATYQRPQKSPGRSVRSGKNNARNGSGFQFQARIESNTLSGLEILNAKKTLRRNFRGINYKEKRVDMSSLGIKKFARDWCRLKNDNVPTDSEINFKNNNIANTSNLAESLPQNIATIRLMRNKITILQTNALANPHTRNLYLSWNKISMIEDNAINMPELRVLNLTLNKIIDMKFVKTLPSRLGKLNLDNNNITDIPKYTFSKLEFLTFVSLRHNRITEIRQGSFSLAFFLRTIDLSYNPITGVEAGAFNRFVRQILLHNCRLTYLDSGSFANLQILRSVDLSGNEIQEITDNELTAFTLIELDLSYNNITKIYSKVYDNNKKDFTCLDISHNPVSENGELMSYQRKSCDSVFGVRKYRRMN